MPMVWDEQVGAMVWEEDVVTPTAAQPAQTIYDRFQQLTANDPTGRGIRTEAPGTLANAAASTPLPLLGSVLGSRFGAPGQAIGGALGEGANQLLGITPHSKASMTLSALPGPASQAAAKSTMLKDQGKRIIAASKPEIGAALAEDAVRTASRRVGEMNPVGTTAAKEYEKLRADPSYSSLNETGYYAPSGARSRVKMPTGSGMTGGQPDIEIDPIINRFDDTVEGGGTLRDPTTDLTTRTDTPPATNSNLPTQEVPFHERARQGVKFEQDDIPGSSYNYVDAQDVVMEMSRPIQLSEAGKIGVQYARKLKSIQRNMPGLAKKGKKAAQATHVDDPNVTFEEAHDLIREHNAILSRENLKPDVRAAHIRSKAAIYRDIMRNPLSPQLRKANEAFGREMAVEDLYKTIKTTDRTKGFTEGADAGSLIDNLQRTYDNDEFIQAAIHPVEFSSMINELKQISLEQQITKDATGSLAQYGVFAGAGGGAGATLAATLGLPPGVGGIAGGAGAMLALKAKQMVGQKQAFHGNPVSRQAALQAFRTTPQIKVNPSTLEMPLQGGVQSIAEMFLRNRGIDPTLQPSAEDELP